MFALVRLLESFPGQASPAATRDQASLEILHASLASLSKTAVLRIAVSQLAKTRLTAAPVAVTTGGNS